MSFYVTVYSDASRSSFSNNKAASFTRRLNKQIILNGEYNVAVASIISYRREKVDEPIHLSRDRRREMATTAPNPVCTAIPQSFPTFPMSDGDKARLDKARLAYIKSTTPIIFINSLKGDYIELELMKNRTAVKSLTHRFRYTELPYLTEETHKKILFLHTFTDNGHEITVRYGCEVKTRSALLNGRENLYILAAVLVFYNSDKFNQLIVS